MNAHPVETVKTVIAANAEQFEIEPHLWLRNQQQQHLLLRYLALPLRENEQTLWLGVDSPANLAACETFSFAREPSTKNPITGTGATGNPN